jgi:hypothetical protein
MDYVEDAVAAARIRHLTDGRSPRYTPSDRLHGRGPADAFASHRLALGRVGTSGLTVISNDRPGGSPGAVSAVACYAGAGDRGNVSAAAPRASWVHGCSSELCSPEGLPSWSPSRRSRRGLPAVLGALGVGRAFGWTAASRPRRCCHRVRRTGYAVWTRGRDRPTRAHQSTRSWAAREAQRVPIGRGRLGAGSWSRRGHQADRSGR